MRSLEDLIAGEREAQASVPELMDRTYDVPSRAEVRLDERVRCCRIDAPHDGIHGHSGVPLLDV